MKNLVLGYNALPHTLIAGGIGGGKTYFLLNLIEALLQTNVALSNLHTVHETETISIQPP